MYGDHLVPKCGKAKDIAKDWLSLILDNESSNSLQALGCDGCPTNTGIHSGIIRSIEVASDRPLQWLVCMLHLNELPLKHLFEFLDGMTGGTNSFKGTIGKAINDDLRLLPIADFQPTKCYVDKLPEIIISELSTDQHFFYHISMTVQHGRVYLLHHNLTSNSPGALNQARWLTTANRILRLYISTPNPSEELVSRLSF